MIVKDLIEKLQMCNPNAVVCYDMSNAIKNSGVDFDVYDNEAIYGVEDIEFINGIEDKFIYLTEVICTQE